jgi:hypothetical protein
MFRYAFRLSQYNHSKMDREFESINLSTEAQMLLADMWDGCMVSKSRAGAPGGVTPRQELVPRTNGQASDRAINELIENDLAHVVGDTKPHCRLMEKGQAFARYRGERR